MINYQKLDEIFKESQKEFLLSLEKKFEDAMILYFSLSISKDINTKQELLVFFHSLKGTSATFKFDDLSSHGKKMEIFLNSIENMDDNFFFQLAEGIGIAYSKYLQLYSDFFKSEAPSQEAPKISQALNILIIDDDESILNYVKLSRETFGYKLFTASNEKDMFETLSKESIDLILLDIIMQGTDGISLFKELQGKGISIPVIFLTGANINNLKIKTPNANFIKKPLDVNEIVTKIENISKIKSSTNKKIPLPHSAELYSPENKPTLLLIEDDEGMLNLLKSSLEDLFTIYHASDGELGLKKYFELLPNIIITDLMLPKLDGFEVCKRIRENISEEKTKLVVLSAKNDEETIITSFALGIDEFIHKPFNINELIVRLNKLL